MNLFQIVLLCSEGTVVMNANRSSAQVSQLLNSFFFSPEFLRDCWEPSEGFGALVVAGKTWKLELRALPGPRQVYEAAVAQSMN